jgi:hypothetical protein
LGPALPKSTDYIGAPQAETRHGKTNTDKDRQRMRFKFNFLVAFVFITVSISGCATPAPRGELQEALASFEKRVARADQAIFFYAGHSLQINGENYLMPVESER